MIPERTIDGYMLGINLKKQNINDSTTVSVTFLGNAINAAKSKNITEIISNFIIFLVIIITAFS